MPFGLDLDDITDVGRALNPFDDDDKKKKKRKKPKRPSKVPKTAKKKEYTPQQAVKDLLIPGAMFGKVFGGAAKAAHAPGIITKNIEHVAELGAGLLPAAKTVGEMGYRDVRKLGSRKGHDRPSLDDMTKYYDLLKYGWEDDPKKKRPKADSEIVGLLAEIVGSYGKSIERAVPEHPFSASDRGEFRKAWTDDLVLTLLDVLPVAAAISRPLSAAKIASKISKANDISRGRAIATGVRESYHPGTAARRGLEGGIEPRKIKAEVGGEEVTVGGRPWSRIPAIRGLQRATDRAYQASPSLARKRVGAHQRRLEAEEVRRVKLQQKELERPIGELLYGRVGRNLGAFGLKEGMNAKERRFATGLAYATQMPKWMDPADALAAVQNDLSAVFKSGKMEVPSGRGRVKRLDLSKEEKENLAVQISDMDYLRKELDDGDINPEEWKAAQEAMGDIAKQTHDMGIDIMQRRYKLDPDEVEALEAAWKSRAEVLPRRLAARGHFASGNLADSQIRADRLEELTGLLDEEQANFLIGLTDARARAVRPQDPASYYADRIGAPTGETAQEYVARIGDEALFPQAPPNRISDLLFGGAGEARILDTGEFYSPLQKWVDETMPDEMPAAQMHGTLKNHLPPAEYENANLWNFFHDKDPKEIVYKTEFQAHMANPLNAYNFREILLSNADGVPEDLGSVFDLAHDGNYMARDPAKGEYFELLLQLPGPEKYLGKGYGHWDRENIVAHVRFHIFHEDGKQKMLIEEIQSDWGNEYRARMRGEQSLAKLDPDERAEIEEATRNLGEATERQKELRQRNYEIDRELQQADDRDLHMEYFNNMDELDSLSDYITDMERYLKPYKIDGTPVAPLGTGTGAKSSYLNPTVRWLLRRADEAGVDEIHVLGREVQLGRNAEVNPKIFHDLKEDGAEAITQYFRDNPYTKDRSFIGYEEDIPNTIAREMGEAGEKVETVEGTYRFAGVPAEDAYGKIPTTVFRMTDEAKRRAKLPASMYQRQPNWKGLPHGATELLDKGTRVHMFETGNVSTWIHELGHVGLYDLSADDLRVIETHVGGGFALADWTKMEHERFARSFEQYVRKGVAPNKELAAVFSKLSAWMKQIWSEMKIRKTEDIPEGVSDVFDRMFAGAPEPDEFGVHGYFPHRDIHSQARTDYRGGVRPPAAGQVMGQPRLTGETVQRKPNELMLYQAGAMNPDPGGLVNVFLNRLRFQATLDARDSVYPIANPMSEPIPKGKRVWLIRNPDTPPERITPRTQAAARGDELERPVEEDLEEVLRMEPEDFRKEIIAKTNEGEHPRWAEDMENVRWIEADYMESRFGEVFAEKPRGKMWSAMGMLTSLQRTTGIYGRPISYIGGNVPFNMMALLSSMPVSSLRNVSRAFDIRRNDPALWRAMNSESGETRAGGGLPERYVRPQNRMQEAEQRTTAFQRGMAEKLSGFADDPFRSIAFLNNARKMGYKTNADLKRLIKEDGTDLHDVRQRVREQMLDFDALNPTQRKIASQFLYLWPFMYASVKWPAMFAREYPLRAAVASNAIQREPEKGLPQEVTNLWKRFGIDLTTVNPLGPAGQVAEDLGAFTEDPSKLDLTALKERLSPTLDALVEGMGGGRENALQNFIRGTVPGASEYFAKDPEFRGAKIYKERGYWDYLRQRHLRYWPRGVNKERLQEMIDDALSDKVKGTAIEKERDADWEKLSRYAKAVGDYGPDEVEEIRTSYTAWWEYQEAVEQKKDSLGQRKLTAYQQIEVLTPIVEEHFPDLAPDLWSLEGMDSEAYQKRNKKAMEDYADALKEAVNEGRTRLFNDYSRFGPQS